MERAETKIASSSFFQFYKIAYYTNYINPAKYLLYGILAYQLKKFFTLGGKQTAKLLN